LKNRGIFLLLPVSLLNVDWRKRKRMNSSVLECEACLVHFKGIKGESDWI